MDINPCKIPVWSRISGYFRKTIFKIPLANSCLRVGESLSTIFRAMSFLDK